VTQQEFNVVVALLLEQLLAEILHRNSYDTDSMQARIEALRLAFPAEVGK